MYRLEHVTFYALAREIALGMNFLHSHTPEPVLHLNLKSTNVMLTDQLHVRIADFGFNKLRCARPLEHYEIRQHPTLSYSVLLDDD